MNKLQTGKPLLENSIQLQNAKIDGKLMFIGSASKTEIPVVMEHCYYFVFICGFQLPEFL